MEQAIAFVGGCLAVALIYFIYTKVKESRNKPSGGGSGGSGGGGKDPGDPPVRPR